MDVSIVIVNYNTKELTEQCIDSVYEKTSDVSFEVILVDNASNDGSRELFQNDSRITYIYSDENLGFGLANNEGFQKAKGRYVFCLNPDTLLLNNAIKILCEFLNDHPYVGICGGNLYDADMKPTHSYRMMLPSLWWELDYHFDQIYTKLRWGQNAEFNHTENPIPVGYITGADMMIRKDIIDKIGGFSKYFFMYYEECELTWRIRKVGYKFYSVPSAHIQHLEGKSFKSSEFTQKDKLLTRSRWIYRKLCFSSLSYWLLTQLAKLKSLIRNEESTSYQIEVAKELKGIGK